VATPQPVLDSGCGPPHASGPTPQEPKLAVLGCDALGSIPEADDDAEANGGSCFCCRAGEKGVQIFEGGVAGRLAE
jgi:hypothetical protein